MKTRYAIIAGVPTEGFELTGPFDSWDDAVDWGELEYEGVPWWHIAELAAPTNEPCDTCGATTLCDCTVALTDLPLVGKEMEKRPRKTKVVDLRVLPHDNVHVGI